jgi:ABC-2 type transport system ATP-binding protein
MYDRPDAAAVSARRIILYCASAARRYTMPVMTREAEDGHFELIGVSKSFKQPVTNPFKKRTSIQALTDVTFRIFRRKVTCLLGPNGAGKTTLIKILASLITPDSGQILCDQVPLERLDRSAQGRIGLVTPNDRSFYWRLTGRQNLMFFGSLYSLRGKSLKERVAESLADSGMTADADKPYRLYSSGMKQKLNIARALLGDPVLYLLDEPAAHLDPLARAEFWRFVEETLIEKRKATVFLCTHDLEEARRLADHLYILHKGRIVNDGEAPGLGEASSDLACMELRFSGEVPASWIRSHESMLTLREPGRIIVKFKSSSEFQEGLLRSFVVEGGALTQARLLELDLFELLERGVGNNG